MYEYSLSSYLGVFDTALRDAKPDKIVDNRLKPPGGARNGRFLAFAASGSLENRPQIEGFEAFQAISSYI